MADDWPKPQITVELAARLITEQFPRWKDLPIRPVVPDGWDNTTFRLGDALSIRLPSHRDYAAQVDKEHTWLPRLTPHLPLPIPVPIARGEPNEEYPLPWSVYRWLPGQPAGTASIDDRRRFAAQLGEFLTALERIDAGDGPPPGAHNFFRGGDLSVYDEETRAAIAGARSRIDAAAATNAWETARAARWTGRPVWIHGDIAPGNLLIEQGTLCGVIDFGCAGVGDPACDLVIAWTFLDGEAREAFQATLAMDDATWARARGWALWKALIKLDEDAGAQRVVDAVLAEHAYCRTRGIV